MRTFVALLSSAVLLGLTGLAQAEKLVSPPFPTQLFTSGACYVRNTGTTPVSVQVSLFSNNGLIVSTDTCNDNPLAAGETCVILVNDLPDDSFAACSLTAGTVAKLRGTFEIRENIGGVLRVIAAEDLR